MDARLASEHDLSAHGILNIATLRRRLSSAHTTFLVDGLIREKSVNVLVGNSTLGKTPLAVSMGIAIASGTPWFDPPTRQGGVLYIDSESNFSGFDTLLTQLSKAAGLGDDVPKNLKSGPRTGSERMRLDGSVSELIGGAK